MAKKRKPAAYEPGDSVGKSYRSLLHKQSREEFYEKQTQAAGCIGASKHEIGVKRHQWAKWMRSSTGLTKLQGNLLLRVFRSGNGYRFSVSSAGSVGAGTISDTYPTEEDAKTALVDYLKTIQSNEEVQP
jgi:hypothetical protein